jgi:hypothetical protein
MKEKKSVKKKKCISQEEREIITSNAVLHHQLR